MEIRRILSEEINTIVKMWVDFVADQRQYDDFFVTSTEGQLKLKNKLHEYLKDDDYLLIGAFEENELTGYLLAQISEHPPFFENTRFCNLRHIYIVENHRDKGYGSKLVNYAKEWAIQKGINRIELLVAASNKKAIQFYYNHGFNDFCFLLANNFK